MEERYERWEYKYGKDILFVVLVAVGLVLAGYVFAQILEVSETFNAFSEIKPAPAPAVVVPAVVANETKETPEPHQFTPDVKVFGSPEFVKTIQGYLEELNQTPAFRINGKTAYEYVTYYLDALYEGEYGGVLILNGKEYWGRRDGYPPGVIMLSWTTASNLVHLSRHQEQDQLERDIWRNIVSNCPCELDAIKKQTDWLAVRYNLTAEQKEQYIKAGISQYKDWETGQTCVP